MPTFPCWHAAALVLLLPAVTAACAEDVQDMSADPARLVGAWTVTEIAGTPVPAGAEVTMDFSADGRVSGKAACNRYFGGYVLSETGLGFGPAAATRMACEDALMQAEAAMFAAMSRATGFGFDDDGALLIRGGGDVVIRARQ